MKRFLFAVLFLFSAASFVYAGCFATHEPKIDEDNTPECFRVIGESCLGRVELYNFCSFSFKIHNVSNCEIKEDSAAPGDEKRYDRVRSLLHTNEIEIPPDWRLTFFRPKYSFGKVSLYYNSPGVDLDCDAETIKPQSFVLNLESDSGGEYLTRGSYLKIKREKEYDEGDLVWALVLVFGVALSIFFISYPFWRKKNKK